MHSMIRQGQFHGQLQNQPEGQMRSQRSQPLSRPNGAHAIAYAGQQLGRGNWDRRGFVRGGPPSGRIDVCRLIVATLGLSLYLALPVAAVSFAFNLLFG